MADEEYLFESVGELGVEELEDALASFLVGAGEGFIEEEEFWVHAFDFWHEGEGEG